MTIAYHFVLNNNGSTRVPQTYCKILFYSLECLCTSLRIQAPSLPPCSKVCTHKETKIKV